MVRKSVKKPVLATVTDVLITVASVGAMTKAVAMIGQGRGAVDHRRHGSAA